MIGCLVKGWKLLLSEGGVEVLVSKGVVVIFELLHVDVV